MKTIYFDIGNVLIFFSRDRMLNQISACTGLKKEELYRILFDDQWLEKYETGKITTVEVYQRFKEISPRTFSPQELIDAASDIFTPNQEIWPLIQDLKQKGHRLILLSNTSECHFSKVSQETPLLELFDHRILSYEVGFAKPDPKIFRIALEAAQCPPEECFYTDDVPEFIASARSVGLRGEIFTDIPTLKKHLMHSF